jgi:hypothetical protein
MSEAVRFSRNWRMVTGGFRRRTIVVDGKKAGSIKQGERAGLPVDPGRHALRLGSSGLMRRPGRSFEIAGGHVAGSSCRSRPFGALTVPSCRLWW